MNASDASHTFVVFGASGDLSQRKLLPALARLGRTKTLSMRRLVVGVGRDKTLGDEGFRKLARRALEAAEPGQEDLANWCDECLFYQPVAGPEDYRALATRIAELEAERGIEPNRVFYLSIPPQAFAGTVEGLASAGLHESSGWTRLVIEKPFGLDLASAVELNRVVHRWFDEERVFRIDHFLGKETVQNLLVLRFANQVFESIWNRDRIRDVQITVAETSGIGGRGGYYDNSGALRDMVQNHLTQILTLLAMDVPSRYDAESIHHEKRKVLRSIRPIRAEDVVFGRYGAGKVDGKDVRAYADEKGVPASSRTETFVALALEVDSWRWQGVPFYLRTGKRMARRVTEVAVTFRRPPVQLFESLCAGEVDNDVLVLRLQPDEGFALHIDVKRPGSPAKLAKIPLSFDYQEAFGEPPDAYVTLLEDVLRGDSTLFVHADEVEDSWRLFDPILAASPPLEEYAPGTFGPQKADDLVKRRGHVWRTT